MTLRKTEVEANKMLALLGENISLPVAVESIVVKLGIKLLSYDLGDELSGLLVIEDGISSIGYNKNESRVRNRFTIAHELGHFALHTNKNKQGQTIFVDKEITALHRANISPELLKYRDQINQDPTQDPEYKKKEREANEFAACILMPRELVSQEFKKMDWNTNDEIAMKTLAKRFDVSSVAMSFRIVNLGLINVS